MTAPRRGAIIGFGKVAELGHLPGWLASSRFEIVAVADPSAERRLAAERTLPGVRTYSDHRQLLEHQSLDFVDIASPPAFHAAPIAAAASRGLDVVCEKPLTTSAEDYSAARRAVAEARTTLYPVHNWKCSEAFRIATETLEQGTLGGIQRIKFTTHRNGWAASDNDWRAQSAIAGGGILVDHGWHTFYLLLSLARLVPKRIKARIEKRRYPDADVEDTAWCQVEFEHCTGEIELTWAASERMTRWEVFGERGSLVIDDDRVELNIGETPVHRQMAMSLSKGSHHPEWFPGMIDGFDEEIRLAPERRSAQREAESCLCLLVHAYTSARDGGKPIDLPDPEQWLGSGTSTP